MALTDEELRALARACPRALSGWGRTTPQQDLRALADEAARGGEADRYGAGGVVAEVEEQVRLLLGAPAALLLPSGTMAQQVALAYWSHGSRRRVAMHATAHPLLHEDDALPVVQGLVPVVVGQWPSLPAIRDAHQVAPLAAVLVELPQRETGGALIGFDELAELSRWCRAEQVRLHLDGARLWECAPAYSPHALADVVALADSTYVSLYKGLGALAGALLLGPPELVDAARTARHRLGGTLPALWPLALGARRGLREVLPQVPAWVQHARALAAALAAEGLSVRVQPVVPLLHVVLPGVPEQVQDALVAVSQESGTWLGRAQPGPDPFTSVVEVSVLGASLEVPPAEGAVLLARAARLGSASSGPES